MITNVIRVHQDLKDAMDAQGCEISVGASKRLLAAFGGDGSTVTVAQLAEAIASETVNMFGWLEENDPIMAEIALKNTYDKAHNATQESFSDLDACKRESFKWRCRAMVNASAADMAESIGFTVLRPTRRLGDTYVIVKKISNDANNGQEK